MWLESAGMSQPDFSHTEKLGFHPKDDELEEVLLEMALILTRYVRSRPYFRQVKLELGLLRRQRFTQ